jgi:hypothetical protein
MVIILPIWGWLVLFAVAFVVVSVAKARDAAHRGEIRRSNADLRDAGRDQVDDKDI